MHNYFSCAIRKKWCEVNLPGNMLWEKSFLCAALFGNDAENSRDRDCWSPPLCMQPGQPGGVWSLQERAVEAAVCFWRCVKRFGGPGHPCVDKLCCRP